MEGLKKEEQALLSQDNGELEEEDTFEDHVCDQNDKRKFSNSIYWIINAQKLAF